MMIKIEDLVGGYAKNPIIHGVNLEIHKGEFFVLLGPNGSGKTTLFKLLTGQLPIHQGQISIAGKPLSKLTKIEKAKKVAVLTQEVQISFDFTVEEIVRLGRYPHQTGIFKRLSTNDQEVIETVMSMLKVDHFRNTPFRMISGGEKQRVLLAKALAQEPEILLLDEPTNHLDIKHTFQMLDMLKEWQQTKNLTIFAILHDLNVASLYANRVALLYEGKLLDVGDVNTLRKEDQLEKVYEVQVKSQSHPIVPKPQLLMTPTDSFLEKNGNTPFSIEQKEAFIHLQFEQPLRTISNGVVGNGIQWFKHFCFFHTESNDHSTSSQQRIQTRMETHNIPYEQSVGIMTREKLEQAVIVTRQVRDLKMMAVVMIDRPSKAHETRKHSQVLHPIHTMVFIDGHLSDASLVSSYMAAAEAKAMTIQEFKAKQHNSLPLGGWDDRLVVAAKQQGNGTVDVEEMAACREMMTIVREAMNEAMQKYVSSNSIV